MNSIITDDECCFLCGSTQNLHCHHCIGGTSNRKQSDKHGLTVYLCVSCHTGSNNAVHNDRKTDLYIKRIAQICFERQHSREEFIKTFGKSFL